MRLPAVFVLIALPTAAMAALPSDMLTATELARAAAGDSAAIAAAREALRTSDAGNTDMLQDALGRAMQVSPERILPLVDTAPELRAQNICLPFLSEDDPKAEIRATILRTRDRLDAVRDPQLAAAKAACMSQVRRNLAALDR